MARSDANNLTVSNIIIGAGELEVDGTNVGFTRDGVTFAYERTILEIKADQKIGILKTKRTDEILTISTMLLEATLDMLKIAWGVSGTISTGGGTSELKFGGQSDCGGEPEHALWFSGPGPDCKTRYVEIYKAFSLESGEHTYSKEGEVVIPVVFRAIQDTTKDPGEEYGRILDVDVDWVD